jgi:hypothetical protein
MHGSPVPSVMPEQPAVGSGPRRHPWHRGRGGPARRIASGCWRDGRAIGVDGNATVRRAWCRSSSRRPSIRRCGSLRVPFHAHSADAGTRPITLLVPGQALRLGLRPAEHVARLGRARGVSGPARTVPQGVSAPPESPGVHRQGACAFGTTHRDLLVERRAS